MRRELPGGYELDDDSARIDVDAVHGYLAEESYWARGRAREVVEELVGNGDARYRPGVTSPRGSQQIGFARVVSDGHTFAYLADVYVLAEHRGGGRGCRART